MNSSPPEPKEAKLVDPDLVEQAVVGHGVPSQDPADAAQFALEPGEAERESKSALMGGGAVAGMAAGAVVGAVVAGPLGVLVGGTLGSVAGALGGSAAGEMVHPDSADAAGELPQDAKDADGGTTPG